MLTIMILSLIIISSQRFPLEIELFQIAAISREHIIAVTYT